MKIAVMGIIASLCSLFTSTGSATVSAQTGNFKSVEVDNFEKVIADKDVVCLDVQ